MIPGMNPRKMQAAMRKLGIAQQEIEATEVIIRCPDRDLIIRNPQVAKVNMMGQDTLQINGEIEEIEKDTTPDLNEEDIKTVMQQAEVDKETATEALKLTKGDIAEAIMGLKE